MCDKNFDREYHKKMLALSNSSIKFLKKDVLEVGGCEFPELIQKYNPKSWTSIDISDNRLNLLKNSTIPDFYNFRKMNIENSTFSDNSFDYIYSLDCFEHISDLNSALGEMYRVLKPNGFLVAKFGPIWSSPIGHHTWFEHNNKLYHFNDNLFNDWYHLAFSKDEFIRTLRNKYPEEILNKIAYSVYESYDINRMVDSDYIKAIKKNNFIPILILRRKLYKKKEKNIVEKVVGRYPQIQNLNTTTFLIILSKKHISAFDFFKIYRGVFSFLIKDKLLTYIKLPWFN